MSEAYAILKWLHIVSSAVLLGTGAGIAFFFLRAHKTGDMKVIAAVSKEVVLADYVFTATAVVLQPLSGLALIVSAAMPWNQGWLILSMLLYVLVGCCWIPVVWLQTRMRDIAVAVARSGSQLPPEYALYYRKWVFLGWPAFAGVLAIFYLMTAKPTLWTS